MFDGLSGTSVKEIPFEAVELFIDMDQKMCDATSDRYIIIDEPGASNHNDLYILLDIQEVQDSVILQLIHNWAPPDSMLNPPNGLRLSDYRYWTIRGIADDGFNSKAYFIYNSGDSLDNTLILSPTDSVVLMYRPHAGVEWEQQITDRIGSNNYGLLILDDLRIGEYTLAVLDTQVGESEVQPEDVPRFGIYPNPAYQNVNIEYFLPEGGKLDLIDSNGKVVKTRMLASSKSNTSLSLNEYPSGIYLIQLTDYQNNRSTSKRLVVK